MAEKVTIGNCELRGFMRRVRWNDVLAETTIKTFYKDSSCASLNCTYNSIINNAPGERNDINV